MTRSLFGLYSLTWCETVLTSPTQAPQPAKDPVNIDIPLFSRGFNIVADSNNSHLLATLNLLYSIPKMQEIIYTEADKIISACPENECRKDLVKNSLIVSTAVALAHMRLSNEPLNLNDFYQDSLSAALGPPSSTAVLSSFQSFSKVFQANAPDSLRFTNIRREWKVFFELDESVKGCTNLDSIMATYPLVGRNWPLCFTSMQLLRTKIDISNRKRWKGAGLKYFASHEFPRCLKFCFQCSSHGKRWRHFPFQ